MKLESLTKLTKLDENRGTNIESSEKVPTRFRDAQQAMANL